MKEILEKAKQHPVLVAVAILVVAMLVTGYQCGVSREAKRTARIFEKQAEDAKKEADRVEEVKEEENKKLREDSLAKDKVITETKAKNVELVRKRAEDKRLLEELKGEIAKEKPVELVDRARRILNTDEIWWNEATQRIEFSLQAFRGGVIKLTDWEDFTLRREPDYLKEIANDAIIMAGLKGKIENFGIEVGNLKLVIKGKDTSYDTLKDAFDEYKRLSGKKGGLLTQILWGMAGFGLGAAFGK